MKQAGLIILAFIVGGLAGYLVFSRTQTPTEPPVQLSDVQSVPFANPSEFRIEPCPNADMRSPLSALTPCILLQAGGKRLVFGAPLHQDWRAIGQLDGVFLFDGHPQSSGGLAGLRYETWFNGRKDPLLLITGELFLETVQASDDALLVPDALAQVERPQLDARQAGFVVKPIPTTRKDMLVFNTGDLQVFANADLNPSGDQMMSYRVDYVGVRLDLASCESRQIRFGGTSDALVIPMADREWLTDLRNRLDSKTQPARLQEIAKVGRDCPTPGQAIEMIENQETAELIAYAPRPRAGHLEVSSTKIINLSDGAVTLYSPDT